MNFFRLSSNFAGAVALAIVCGCSPKDGVQEFKDAQAAYEVKDFAKAVKLLEKSLVYAPNNVDARVNLVRAQMALGEMGEAAKTLAAIGDGFGDDLDIRQLGAQIAWHLKEYDKALKLFNGLANDGKLDAATRSEGLTGVGIVKMTIGERHAARIAFLKAIRLDSKNAAARYHLGLLYREAPFGYNEAALEQFEAFVYLNKTADARVQRVQKSIIPSLKDAISRAASERPGASMRNSAVSAATLREAEAAWKKGDFKTARTKYEASLKADALSYPAALGLAKAVQKLDTSKAGMLKALENYKVACSLKPSASATFIIAGELALRLGMNANASEIFSRALAANPTSTSAVEGLVRALNKSGNRKQATIAKEYQTYRNFIAKKGK